MLIKNNSIYQNIEWQTLINKKSIAYGLAPLKIKLQINLNIGCNLSCIMCDGRRYSSEPFHYNSIFKIMDFLDSETISEVKIIGGEPLLDKNGLLNVVRKGAEKDIPVHIVTNGCFLDQQYLDELIHNGIGGITLSVDGVGDLHDQIRREPGLFNKIQEILFYMKKRHPRFKRKINCVVMKRNIDSIFELVHWADKMGIHMLGFCRVENYNRNYGQWLVSEHDYKALADKLSHMKFNTHIHMNQIYCNARKNMDKCDYLLYRLNINDQGKITPCYSDDNPFILDRPIKELYRDRKFRDYILNKANTCRGCGKY